MRKRRTPLARFQPRCAPNRVLAFEGKRDTVQWPRRCDRAWREGIASVTPDTRTRAEDLPLRRRIAAFALLMIFEFFYGWSFNTVDVLRPQLRANLHLSLTQAGSSYTAQSLGALVGAVVLGQIADRFGRRRMLSVIVIGYALMGAAGVLVHNYPGLLVQRFALGLFLGGIFPVLNATYMGLFPSRIRGKLTSIGQGTYNLSVMALGASLGWAASRDWHILLWAAAIPPLLAAPLIGWLIPDDKRVRPWGADASPPPLARLPIADLFAPALRPLTVRLFALVACNFFAYQAFAGWTTTYLKDTLHFDPVTIGDLVQWQFAGALIGGFFWGWFADRFGRRLCAIGFAGGALCVLAYLFAANGAARLRWVGAAWGFLITASVAWAPWMSELFPAHLRSTAMGIFNWGRIVSMTAPLITGVIAAAYGLPAAMTLGAVGFALGAGVWLTLPETLGRRVAA